MPAYEITSFRGALSDYEDKGIEGAFKFGANLDVRKQVDSLSAGQALDEEGVISELPASPSSSISPSSSPSSSISPSPSASPSPTPSHSSSKSPSASVSPSASNSPSSSISPSVSPSSELTSVFKGLILFFVKCSDGFTYAFDNVGYIYRRDSDANWVQVYKDADGEIKGAAEKPSSDGKLYLYWANDRKLKRKLIPGNNDWNDVETVSTNLTSNDWHTMIQIGGALKIANASNLALVGYDDSYTNEALNLIPGNHAKTLVERYGRAIIGTVPASNPNKGVNSAVDCEIPLAQIGDNGELYFANGADSLPIKRFPGGGKTNPGGVTLKIDQVSLFEWEESALSWIDKQEIGNMALFAVYDADEGRGGVYSYGRVNKNHPIVLNLEHHIDADELGAIAYVDGKVLISYRSGTDFGVKATDNSAKAIGIYEGLDFKAPVKKPINITNWKSVEIFMDPLPNGASVEFWYRIDKTGDFVRAKTANNENSYNVANGKKAVFRIGADGQIFEPRIVLNPVGNSSPEVHRIRVYFN